MSVPAAYLGVVLIWATTPLAIKWSGDGSGYLFGVTSRMVIGVALALALIALMRLQMPWHRRARHTYLAAGLGIYVAMLAVYWASQYIPSGWISVLFGLSPVITGLLAHYWLEEVGLTPLRLLAVGLALAGLALIFIDSLNYPAVAVLGVAAMLVSVTIHSASSVWVKRLDAGLHGLVVTGGGLLVAVPLFLLTWFLTGEQWPEAVPGRALSAILYLGVIGSVLGFALYFYVLRHVEATRVALIALMTPVLALLLGHYFNGEALDLSVGIGAGLIMLGLAGFEFADRFQRELVTPISEMTGEQALMDDPGQPIERS
ncbi:DMT family transporter [endosymbiont of Ridgeia piscesae]|jgi:drug/metabolite transporter (DMT)-like permease|uniref:Permease of the drug/metabolite transporter (DMT) superfamily n=1 Tax=endosymbiont of Ridgeia piscesae TaxID=54398 RepID=A0A0T5Z5U3_9GAMM|nr:DMT family transporter [endosymbiont of Ridgeia piscesae]KRT54809.1 Permease of the drug/metabolite transporter (DMT) superfamily [endosymbiont of Ridgeia piscesae]KRT58290.1 Permease of the drug/metabolite transporter (DMT) superfamily [endosymbiont of Ridgeia piscesae]